MFSEIVDYRTGVSKPIMLKGAGFPANNDSNDSSLIFNISEALFHSLTGLSRNPKN